MKKYKGYLIDLDGTMYRGTEPIESAVEFVNELHNREIPYMFITNNSSKTREAISQKLNDMGVPSTAEQVVTSSVAAAMYLKGLNQGASCYLIGEEGLHESLKEEGFVITEDDNCDFVVVGIDRNITYEKYAKACLAIRKGAAFLITNSDKAIPTERGLLPGNGALSSVITVSTGVKPMAVGKPESVIMEAAISKLGMNKENIAMIGDNYDTDIQAGIRAGIDTIMVFTGVTQEEELPGLVEMPTYHVEDLREWVHFI
ncbi:TIGR01457 family HAD-type hydrolase [Virgibacillus kimchii]